MKLDNPVIYKEEIPNLSILPSTTNLCVLFGPVVNMTILWPISRKQWNSGCRPSRKLEDFFLYLPRLDLEEEVTTLAEMYKGNDVTLEVDEYSRNS